MERNKRLAALDVLRGFTVLSMIVYHILWDSVYIFGSGWNLFSSPAMHFWQRTICVTFIALSGFCISLSKRRLKNGVKVLLSSLLIFTVTAVVMPRSKVLFGVLTLIGSCMLIFIPLEGLLKRINPYAGLPVCVFLFLSAQSLYKGVFLFALKVPRALYRNYFTAFLGFPPEGYTAADYFPLFPWLFLFVSGYFLYAIFEKNDILHILEKPRCAPLEWIGQRSLVIYLLHQPIIYFILLLIFRPA